MPKCRKAARDNNLLCRITFQYLGYFFIVYMINVWITLTASGSDSGRIINKQYWCMC